jgi:predicted MFS family arabinose efflux permease
MAMSGWLRPRGPVLSLAVARFLGAVATYMVLPFIAVRLTQAGSGLAVAGVVAGIGPLVRVLAGTLGGVAADHLGRRRTMLLGNTLSILAMAGFAFSQGALAYALLNGLQGLARAVSGPAQSAAIADVTLPEERAQAYAYGRVAMNVGAAIGPFLGAFFVVAHPTAVFLGAALASLLVVLLLFVTVPETGRQLRTVTNREAMRRMGHDPSLWLYVLGGAMQLGVYMVIETIFPAFLRGAVPGGLELYAVMTLVNTAMVAVGQIPLNRWLGGLSPAKGFAAGLGFFAIAYLGIAYLRNPLWLILDMVVFTAGEMTVFVVMPAYEASMGDEAVRGRTFGALSVKQAGAALAPLVVGGLLQFGGAHLAFPAVAAIAVCSGLILAWSVRMRARRSEGRPAAQTPAG